MSGRVRPAGLRLPMLAYSSTNYGCDLGVLLACLFAFSYINLDDFGKDCFAGGTRMTLLAPPYAAVATLIATGECQEESAAVRCGWKILLGLGKRDDHLIAVQ